MIELTSFTPQLQAAHWGWTIAIFLWLVGSLRHGIFPKLLDQTEELRLSSDGVRYSRNALSRQPFGPNAQSSVLPFSAH